MRRRINFAAEAMYLSNDNMCASKVNIEKCSVPSDNTGSLQFNPCSKQTIQIGSNYFFLTSVPTGVLVRVPAGQVSC